MKEEVKAGIIILSALLLLSVSVILIGGSRFFNKFDVYHVKVMNAAGLETGAQVRLGGVRVGRVLDVKTPSGPGMPVLIDIGVEKGTPIYKGTKALITQIGFVGDIYLLLAVDRTANGKLRPGEDIPAEETSDFARLMAKMDGLSQSLDGLIRDADKMFSKKNMDSMENLLAHADEAVVSGTSNIEKISSSLKKASDKLERVLSEVESVVATNKGEISLVIKRAREDLERAGDLIKTIDSAVKNVDNTTASAGRAIGIQSRNLDALLDSMTRTTEDLRDVLQDIKQKPWSIIYKEGDHE